MSRDVPPLQEKVQAVERLLFCQEGGGSSDVAGSWEQHFATALYTSATIKP